MNYIHPKLLLVGILLSSCMSPSFAEEPAKSELLFPFGVIADCQYCGVKGTGARKYSISDQKLTKCVEHLNTLDLAYTVHLGDFIDRDFKSFDVVGPIYNQLKMPKYHVLGNHDFSVADEEKKLVPQKMGLQTKYYHFGMQGWRFVVLDGNDISFHAYPKDSENYQAAAKYYEEQKISSPKWNGAVSSKQLDWLNSVLKQADIRGENVVLYCHFPVYPENVHNLWNAKEVIKVIESYDCVKAYINGHNHHGNYAQKSGVHYLTMKGMVDTEETSYATIAVHDDRLIVTGYGREEDRVLEIKK
ncbi:MAG: metallophosphoesterase [Pirellulales bacterium]|jgi:manganese-dependent ADP-ribose/CDP-alcohol diphosphatase